MSLKIDFRNLTFNRNEKSISSLISANLKIVDSSLNVQVIYSKFWRYSCLTAPLFLHKNQTDRKKFCLNQGIITNLMLNIQTLKHRDNRVNYQPFKNTVSIWTNIWIELKWNRKIYIKWKQNKKSGFQRFL